MIVVTGTIELEAGNADSENPALFRVYEEWESDAHLAAHLKTPHIAEFGRRLQEIKVVSRSIKIMDVAGERDL